MAFVELQDKQKDTLFSQSDDGPEGQPLSVHQLPLRIAALDPDLLFLRQSLDRESAALPVGTVDRHGSGLVSQTARHCVIHVAHVYGTRVLFRGIAKRQLWKHTKVLS